MKTRDRSGTLAPEHAPEHAPAPEPASTPTAPTHVHVLVIGAGCSGIGAGVRLRERGVLDFVILEKGDDFGGAWRENTYPGCACDVPTALYSFSFAPNPDWSRAFAKQAEIRAYLRRTAEEHGVERHVRFGVEVLEARWRDAEQVWDVRTSHGDYTAQVLVAAAGPLHRPRIPRLEGIAEFPGTVFHSAQWDHGYDLRGKRVAVIGTGASAIQFVPEIQPLVGALHLYQRTAPWVLPKPDHVVPPLERALFRRVPATQRALRRAEFAMLEALAFGFRHPPVMRALQRIGLLHLRMQVRDRALRRALTPSYTLGCKRILLSNTYYRAVAQPNVTVHSTGVRAFRGPAVVGDDGSRAEVDAVIFGTGFHVTDPPIAERIVGDAGRRLSEVWSSSMEAYVGTTVAGFPNLFFMIGPNLGTGHSSAFSIIEAQLDYVVGAVAEMRERRWKSIAVRPEAQRAYNGELQEALQSTVYNVGGCQSYYLDASGKNSTIWPWSTGRLTRRVGSFDPSAYEART
jgi:cation diffusion facilitator CzcD-associated flavoprotein CzcO